MQPRRNREHVSVSRGQVDRKIARYFLSDSLMICQLLFKVCNGATIFRLGLVLPLVHYYPALIVAICGPVDREAVIFAPTGIGRGAALVRPMYSEWWCRVPFILIFNCTRLAIGIID